MRFINGVCILQRVGDNCGDNDRSTAVLFVCKFQGEMGQKLPQS